MAKNVMLVALFLLVLAILITTFFLPLHPDEAVFGTIAHGILQGKLLYRDMFDHKPPGIHYLIAGAFFLFGNSLVTLRLLAITILIASGIGMYLVLSELNKTIGQKGFGASNREVVGWALSFLIYLAFVHGTYALTELMTIPFLLFSLYHIVRHPEKWSFALSGILLGFCFLLKQTTVIVHIPLSLWAVWHISRMRKLPPWRNMLLVTGSSMVPAVLVALYMLSAGNFMNMLQDVIWFNIVAYPAKFSSSTLNIGVYMVLALFPLWYMGLAALQRISTPFHHKPVLYAYILLIIFISIIRPYHHYWILIISIAMLFAFFGRIRGMYTSRLLFLHAMVFAVVFLAYSWMISYPSYLYQTRQYTYRSECKQDMMPTDYFFSGCVPEDKYFFDVD